MYCKPAKLHQGVRVHEHEDTEGLLVGEAVKPRRVIFLLAAHVCLQRIVPSLVVILFKVQTMLSKKKYKQGTLKSSNPWAK